MSENKKKKFIYKLFSLDIVRFGLVGLLNTLIGTTVMYMCYNIFSFGYWFSSAMNYVVGSIFSFFANKYFTFRNNKKSIKEVIKFSINIALCYLLGYGIALGLTKYVIVHLFVLNLSKSTLEQISMLVGMFFFIFFNYIGQKFFVFM